MNSGMTWGKIVWRAGPLLFIILAISYFAGDGWGAIPSALVAWGTLMLAYVTFLSIKKSIEQGEQFRAENERLRQEDRERASQRRTLDEICGWAEDGIRVLTRIGESEAAGKLKMQGELPSITAKNISIQNSARNLPRNKLSIDLVKKVDKAINTLDEVIHLIDLLKEAVTFSPDFEPKQDELRQCFKEVIISVSKLRVESRL